MSVRDRFNRILLGVLCPPIPLTIVIAVPAFALVIRVLANGIHTGIAYAAYGLSAYALVISITAMVRIIRGLDPFVRALLDRFPILERLITDIQYRAEVSLYLSILLNIIYVGIEIYAGLCGSSAWLLALGGYYAILVIMRWGLVRYLLHTPAGQDVHAEIKSYRTCGCLLLVMSISLACILTFIVRDGAGFTYAGNLIYAMALYAFWAVITAVINMIRFRRQGSPVLSASKVITFVSALVTMLSLETAMLASFGGGDTVFRQRMISATGIAFLLIVLLMAVYMICRSGRTERQEGPT